MKKIFQVAFSLLLSATAFSQEKKVLEANDFELAIKSDSVIVLDVRRPEEFAEGHIENAVNINWQNTREFKVKTAMLDKTKPVYVYCLAGVRSQKAADWLRANGFARVTELAQGIEAWKESDKPLNKPQRN